MSTSAPWNPQLLWRELLTTRQLRDRQAMIYQGFSAAAARVQDDKWLPVVEYFFFNADYSSFVT